MSKLHFCRNCQRYHWNGEYTVPFKLQILKLCNRVDEELCPDCLERQQRVERLQVASESCSACLDMNEIYD